MQIGAAVEQHRNVGMISRDLPHPVVDGENSRDDLQLAGFGCAAAAAGGQQPRAQADAEQNGNDSFQHNTLFSFTSRFWVQKDRGHGKHSRGLPQGRPIPGKRKNQFRSLIFKATGVLRTGAKASAARRRRECAADAAYSAVNRIAPNTRRTVPHMRICKQTGQ